MTAIASVLNPLVSHDAQLMAFYGDDNNNLGLALQDSSKDAIIDVNAASGQKPSSRSLAGSPPPQAYGYAHPGKEFLAAPQPPPLGLIRNPSTMTAFQWQNLIRVYGIQGADSTIALVSPGLLALDISTEATLGSLAGCSDSDELAWVYYLKNNPVQINEYDMVTQTINPYQPNAIYPTTNLAAFYDSTLKQRNLVYQSVSATRKNVYPLVLMVGGVNGSAKVIPSTDESNPGTAIAACCSLTSTKYYIYYTVNEDSNIRRVTFDGSHFSDPHTITDPAPPIDQYSNISATAGPDAIHLFYLYDDGQTKRSLYHYRDTDL